MWECSLVEVWSTVSFEHVVMIHGHFIRSNEEFFLCNVYAPCDNGAKQVLWEALSMRLQRFLGKNVCICGDFNAVRSLSERRSTRYNLARMLWFLLIGSLKKNSLVDLLLCCRSFTWYKRNGTSMSRIDRFHLSLDWCLMWPRCMQSAHFRGLSSHCHLLLFVSEDDWGPRPSWMLKRLSEVPDVTTQFFVILFPIILCVFIYGCM